MESTTWPYPIAKDLEVFCQISVSAAWLCRVQCTCVILPQYLQAHQRHALCSTAECPTEAWEIPALQTWVRHSTPDLAAMPCPPDERPAGQAPAHCKPVHPHHALNFKVWGLKPLVARISAYAERQASLLCQMQVVTGYLQAFFMAVPHGAQGVGPSRRKHGLWPVQVDWRSSPANGVGRPCHHTEDMTLTCASVE